MVIEAREGTGIEVDIEEEAIEFIVKWYSREVRRRRDGRYRNTLPPAPPYIFSF